MSYTATSHSIRTGLDLRRILFNAGSNVREAIRFSGLWTGNAFADFLLGLPSQTTHDPTDSFRYHSLNSYNWFVQDDYTVSTRLTLNLGLRYEYNTPDVEKQNRMAQINVQTFQYEIAAKTEHRAHSTIPTKTISDRVWVLPFGQTGMANRFFAAATESFTIWLSSETIYFSFAPARHFRSRRLLTRARFPAT